MDINFPQMSGQQEAAAVISTEAAAANLEPTEGTAMYIVSNRWFTRWCQYSGFQYDPNRKKPRLMDQEQPGPRPDSIDSSDLKAEPPVSCDLTPEQAAGVVTLREGLVDKEQFWMFHEPTWRLLTGWYGVEPGSEIRREYHLVGRRLEVDAQQQHFRVVARPAGGGADLEAVVGASSLCKLNELKVRACQALGLEAEDYDVYDYRGCQQGDKLEHLTFKTLTGCRLQDQQALLLLPKGQPQPAPEPAPSSPVLMLRSAPDLGSTPLTMLSSPRGSGGGYMASSPMSPLSRSFDRAPGWAEDVVYEASGRGHGLAGLGNLGNTCFMNSSLQCLAHSLPLMQTFLTGAYRRDLNKDNPLSLGGKLALAFAALMEKLWRGGVAHVSPKLFKWQLAKFAPQFSGYAQQDSQELLAFLLDGLHEDLNRITDKPYVEDKDSGARPDEEVAAEAWSNYRRRNDSVIVDAFQGLYRSVLICPECGNQSVKFDPLMYLSLPLPSSKMRSFTFTAVWVDGSALPRQYGLEVPKSATVGQLYSSIAQVMGLPATERPEDLLLLTQFNDGTFLTYGDLKARVSSIEDLRSRFTFNRGAGPSYTLFVYPAAAQGPRGGGHPLHIYHQSARSSSFLIPTTPLFLPQDQLAALGAQPGCSEALVAPGGGRDAIDAALQQLLRPFSKHQAPEALAASATGAGVNGSGEQQQQQQQQPQGPAPMAEAGAGEAAAGAGPGPAAGDFVAPAPAPHCDPMDVEQQEEAALPLNGGIEAFGEGGGEAAAAGVPGAAVGDAPWLDTLLDGNGISPSSSAESLPDADADADADASPDGMDDSPTVQSPTAVAAAAAAASDEPFDMWAAQKEEAARAAAAAAADAASSPPFLLKFAKRSSYGSAVSTTGVEPAPLEADQPLLMVAEWQQAAAALYEPKPLLRAEQDASALALADKQRDGGKRVTLADCLETFLHPEQLDAEDSWYCGSCKQHVQADKKLDLWSLPDVLVVHLKRFSYSRYSRDKLDTLVDFPLRGLDMAPYLLSNKTQQAQAQQQGTADGTPDPSTLYDLYAVSNHFGGMGGGHYTAFCRLPGASGGGWFTFDDSHVSPVDESAVKTSAAYVLFYRRQGAQPEEDVAAFLERAAVEQQQQLEVEMADGHQGAADAAVAGQQDGPPTSGGQPVQPHPPPPMPSSSFLSKRRSATIEEEEEEEDGGPAQDLRDDIPAAGAIEID